MRLPWESEGLKLKVQNFFVWQELEHQLVHGEGGEERSAYSGELIDKVIQLLQPLSAQSCRMLGYFIFNDLPKLVYRQIGILGSAGYICLTKIAKD